VPASRKFYKKLYPLWKSSSFAFLLKKRRFDYANKLMNGVFSTNFVPGIKILEIGCANGKDFIQFFKSNENVKLHGLDLKNYHINQNNFQMIIGNARNMPFPDKYFDITVSFGMLEHIENIENLCTVVREIDRISKTYCHFVPSITTPLEPHTVKLFWQLRYRKQQSFDRPLNYFSDSVWRRFEGFADSNVKKFWYIPLVIQDLVIYKKNY
jgi:ubiquinone/menaquinone biosynthesis C-methylase UbiE